MITVLLYQAHGTEKAYKNPRKCVNLTVSNIYIYIYNGASYFGAFNISRCHALTTKYYFCQRNIVHERLR